MWLFLCPHAGTTFTFYVLPIGLSFCIVKCSIAFVCLRFSVDQRKLSLSPSQSHNDGVELLGHLHKWLGKTLGKLQVGGHDAERNAAHTGNRENTTENSGQHEL